jgi:hypothetical protein
MSQHARAELLALANSSGVFPLPSNNSDAQRTESYPKPVVSQAPSNHDCAEPNSFENSFANSSGALSTPSDKYDENAENIDPNSPQNQQNQHPFAVYPRITSILRDSEAYPIASRIAYPPLALRSQYEGAQAYGADESIAAPVPLSYSARSKEVLSSMISPPQPPGFPRMIFFKPYPCPQLLTPLSQSLLQEIRINENPSPYPNSMHSTLKPTTSYQPVSFLSLFYLMGYNLYTSRPQILAQTPASTTIIPIRTRRHWHNTLSPIAIPPRAHTSAPSRQQR